VFKSSLQLLTINYSVRNVIGKIDFLYILSINPNSNSMFICCNPQF